LRRRLKDEGWCAIFDALHDIPQNKLAKWDLSGQGINPSIAKSLAAYVRVSGGANRKRIWFSFPSRKVFLLYVSAPPYI
jgi:hypothetical protein